MSLRHRPSVSANHLSSNHISGRGRVKVGRAARWAVESLESRLLLTTITSTAASFLPQTFTYLADGSTPTAPVYDTIDLFGNITAEIIGRDETTGKLGNLSGLLNGVAVNGGFGGGADATLIGALTPNPPAIQSIAVDPQTGQMYGVQIQQVMVPPVAPATMPTVVNNVNLVSIDKTTGAITMVAEISQQIVAATGVMNGSVTQVPAMTFVGGTLYLDAVVNGTSNLVSLNPTAPTNVSGIQGTFNGQAVTALASVNGTLFGATSSAVFQVSPTNSNTITNMVTPTVTGPIAGIAQGSNGKIYLTTNNASTKSELYWVNPVATSADGTAGTGAIDYGPLSTGAAVGQNPGTMAYDPTTNSLFSFDIATNQLFSVSQTSNVPDAFAIFQIYVTQSDSTGKIFISSSDGKGNLNPYGAGLPGGLSVINAQTGKKITVASPANSGSAIVGGISGGTPVPNVQTPSGSPVVIGVVTAAMGGGSPFADAPYTVGQSITAGIVAAPGTTINTIAVSGVVMGDVHLNGSIDTFYAGWLLTGTTGGEFSTLMVSDPGNFSVTGDIRNLLVTGSIGTDTDQALTLPTYVTGFDMSVGGTIGQVKTGDSLIGNVNAAQSPTAPNLTTNIQEIENRGATWNGGFLGGDKQFYNETFATAQVVGAIPTSVNGLPTAAVIDGTLQADPINQDYVDYYGIPLLAGQSVTCQLASTPVANGPIMLGVFNPDGDLIATPNQLAYRFTADRPGVYRFAVTTTGDPTFTDPGMNVGDIQYELTIQNIGDLAIGGILATNNILDNVGLNSFPPEPEPSFGAKIGDIGVITAGGDILSTNPGNTVVVDQGSLRDLAAGSLGETPNLPAEPEIQVPLGNVGLVSNTNKMGYLLLNLGADPAIGGNYQVVSSVSDMEVNLIADGSIGVIRSAAITQGVSTFHVNANNSTNPGNIDLIDVTGNLGTLMNGGPRLITGPNGNVGYMRVGGITYRDATFGSGTQPEATLYQPGESATLTDDSGAQVVLTPTGTPSIPATGGPTSNDTSGTTVNPNLPQLTITAYGIEGSGGVAIENVTSTGGVTITGTGAESGQTVQIGVVDAQGLGQAIGQLVAPPSNRVVQPSPPKVPNTNGTSGGTTTSSATAPTYYTAPDTAGPQGRTLPLPNPPGLDPQSGSPLNVILNGTARMDAFEVDGGLFSEIVDQTSGDIVNVKAMSVGTLSSNGQLGLTQNHTGAALNGVAVVAMTGPFVDAHNAIILGQAGGVTPGGAGPALPLTTTTTLAGVTTITTVTATVVGATDYVVTSVQSGSNITSTTVPMPAISGTEPGIGTITAANGIGDVNVINGGSIGTVNGSILGPIAVGVANPAAAAGGGGAGGGATGSIYNVNLSNGGIYGRGGADPSIPGIYASGQIGLITNSSPADIRGTVSSLTGLTGIYLRDGSIIGATITVAVQPLPTPITNPVLDIGNIIVSGNGGIIGTTIAGTHIGHIDVYHGFGVLGLKIKTQQGDGTLSGIVADGYGIRSSGFVGGASVGSIIAAGKGQNVSTQVYSADVRLSEIDQFDPYTGYQPSASSDIDIATGASVQDPHVPGNGVMGTDVGIIADSSFVGNRTLGSVSAFQIRSSNPATAPSTFNFANNIGSITTNSDEQGISVITGRIKSFHFGGNVDHLTFQIAGPITNFSIAGNVTGDSTISASGRNGNIGNLRIGGNMSGSIIATRRIGTAIIGGNLTGTVNAAQINSLKVYGTINGGNLTISGGINTFTGYSDLGLPGETFTINGSVKTLKIYGNLNANLVVQGNVGTLFVGQSDLSGTSTNVAGTINLLQIDGDLQSGATITAGAIKHQKILGMLQGVIN